MKNDGVLPLRTDARLHIAGEMFEHMRYQGAGSSMINPTRVTSPKDAFDARGVASVPQSECEVILVFLGLTDYDESEGCDRAHMRLPEDQLREVDALCALGKPVVAVLFGGSPVELPFFDRVSAVLNLYLPGQNGGEAAARLLFGEVNPSGRLAETWPLRYEDVPSAGTFGKGVNEVYAEGCEVGYRYYDKQGVPVRCPFGHGLSYTAFTHSEWEKTGGSYTQTVTNVGGRFGGEVAMLFLEGELRGFEKVYLAPGESRTVTITPETEEPGDWPDDYTIPAEPPRFPVTLESRFTDLQQTFLGRILFHAVLSVARALEKKGNRLPEGPERDTKLKGAFFMRRILESNSPRTLSMSAGKSMPYNFAQAFVELANGHVLRGIGCFMKPIRVPKLPKEEA